VETRVVIAEEIYRRSHKERERELNESEERKE
jgi:hypothetical protein